MLLFTGPSPEQIPWCERATFEAEALTVEARLDMGRHSVSILNGSEASVAETVGPAQVAPGVQAVSSFHLPPYYRWEADEFSCRFTAEWRDGASSLAMSQRHLQSLRPHPRALTINDAAGESPMAALVVGTPTAVVHPETAEPATRIDWRGWHVITVDDPFDGPRMRVLATHTEVFVSV